MTDRPPRIGDVVLYHRYGTSDGTHLPEPSPAVVTKVWDALNGDCQLFVMNPNGVYFNTTPYSDKPKPGHWTYRKEDDAT